MKKNNNMRIIVIDDNPLIHKDFIKILSTSKDGESNSAIASLEEKIFGKTDTIELLPKFEIDVASQGKEGVKKIKIAMEEGRPYALAFVDIRMPPGWDGVETIKHIWEVDSNIQVVICTAYSDYSWEDTIKQLGQKDNLLILKKPFDNIAVRQLACALTKKWQLVEETKNYTQSLEERVQERTESLEISLAMMRATLEKRAALEAELHYQANHDLLTGLANRVLLLEKLKSFIENADQSHHQFGVLFLDLDRFKLVNDSLSHEAGDIILCAVTDRLKSFIGENDVLARLGGDEFVILTTHEDLHAHLTLLANKLLNSFNESFNLDEHQISLSTSIGICIYPRDGRSHDVLLRNADTAMYRAKELGANQFMFYTDELNKRNIERLEKEADLRHALTHNEFKLYYQPQFDLTNERLVSVEALIRWEHPTKGMILPIEFIPLAEDSGLIVPIGEWVLRNACQQIKKWQDEGLPPIRVAVNVTTKQFRLYNFVEIVENILTETALLPEYLELELTENMIINNIDIVKTITDLKKLGVQIVLDDFGTGYSSLNYLREIPVDRLKIDQSYVQNIESNRGDDVIIQAIIAMAKSLHLEVLAEGVETKSQLEFLKKQKCGEVQGFYFSKPISSQECESLLTKSKSIKINEES